MQKQSLKNKKNLPHMQVIISFRSILTPLALRITQRSNIFGKVFQNTASNFDYVVISTTLLTPSQSTYALNASPMNLIGTIVLLLIIVAGESNVYVLPLTVA